MKGMQMLSQETTPHGVDKLARYGWVTSDQRGRYMELPKAALNINRDDYQRLANTRKVLELSKDWSWISCGTITVAYREGKYYVVDGQHRKLAADNRSDIKNMPCMVWEIDEVAEEATAFLKTNTNRKPITSIDRHRANVTRGDQIAIRIEAELARHDLIVSTNTSPKHFKAMTLATKLASTDFDRFVRVLDIAVALAKKAGIPVKERMLIGLFELDRRTDDGLLNSRMRKRILDIGALAIEDSIARAASFYARGGARVFAVGILEIVNKGLQHRFKFTDSED